MGFFSALAAAMSFQYNAGVPSPDPQILFEDTHLIVVAKPAGLLSQGEKTGDVNLVDWARAHVGRNYVGLIHRLDRNTSGVMVLAKRTKSAQRLSDQLREGTLSRTYLAWCVGELKAPARWAHRLYKDTIKNRVRVLSAGDPSWKEGQDAALRATPVSTGNWRGNRLTLVRFELETGRSHQIRVQAAKEGLALLGDVKYGGPKAALGFLRPALHSHELKFKHPMSGEELRFEAELPEDMKNI
ncbi:MAG: RluA family pseudouridine synthase [Bdellovibrionota bacterium]